MRLISPLLKRAVYPSLSKCGYLRRSAPAGIAVITYHGVLPAGYRGLDRILDGNLVSAASLRQQLGFLKSHYQVIRPEDFLLWCGQKRQLPSHSVLLTCDDGLKNTLTEMVPILKELDLGCLFFVTGASFSDQGEMLWYEQLYLMFLLASERIALDLEEIAWRCEAIGKQQKHNLWWDLVRRLSNFDRARRSGLLERVRSQFGLTEGWDREFTSSPPQRGRFYTLGASELRQLRESGMCIGAHTLSHPVLSMAPSDLVWTEIFESRRCLAQILGDKIWAFAYPFGDLSSVTSREFEMAERAGFDCAFVNAGGGFGAKTPRFALPRVHVTADMSTAEFEAHISGFYRRVHGLLEKTGKPSHLDHPAQAG
jgi:peptidoglycan/xylan/chitin deacetylase (PgdA/CDA1 family)